MGVDLHVQLEVLIPSRSISSFARRFGVHPSVVTNWRGGMREVPESRVPELAHAFGLTIEERIATEPKPNTRETLMVDYRVVCMMCSRDEWLHVPVARATRLHATPCEHCGGNRFIEEDTGLQRPGRLTRDRRMPEEIPDAVEAPKPITPSRYWRDVA